MTDRRKGLCNPDRNRLLHFAVCSALLALCFLLFCKVAFADGPSAWLNVNYIETKQYEDGEKIQESDSLFQNYYFRFNKPVTPVISYQLYLRANFLDSHISDAEDNVSDTYRRAIEPAFDILLRNPIYGLDVGARLLEEWSTAGLDSDSRETTKFYYSRFQLTPYALPTVTLAVDREENFDHMSPKETDRTNTRYTGSSWYDLLYHGLKLSYNFTYTRDETKTPLDTISRTINNDLNALYGINYKRSIREGRVGMSAGYQGNYVRNKSEQHATETGDVPFERAAAFGLYGSGDQIMPEVDTLNSVITLIDNVYDAPAVTNTGTINLGQNGFRNHNIGAQLFSSERPVDTLYIYVNQDVLLDNVLTLAGNWRVYRSNFNQPNTWTEVMIRAVSVSEFDRVNNVYRYEIRLTAPQNALFFRVINRETASISDVLVTEIEAFGTDFVPRSGKITNISTFFTHGINFNFNAQPLRTLSFAVNYFLNRSDQNPQSEWESISGAFKNLLSNSIDENSGLISNVTRTYGASSIWQTHRLLTTTVRFQRSEVFDNVDETDMRSNTYSLTLNSNPLPTLDANFSYIRTHTDSFGERQSIADLYLLSIRSRLHRDVNMITDIGYTQTQTFAVEDRETSVIGDTDTTTRYIRGIIDARLTQKFSGNLSCGFTRLSGETSSDTIDSTLILTYRPGRFISFSADFRVLDTDGDTSISEGLLADWLFLPAVRLNASYRYSRVEPGPRTSDMISGYFLWYVTRFLDFQLRYGYTREREEKKTETYSAGGYLTCRFW